MAARSALQDIAQELYGEPLERFTRARNDRAKKARDDGDRGLAAQVKELRKPSVAAWLLEPRRSPTGRTT